VEEPDGKRPIRRSRLRWENNIKMVLTEIGWSCMHWINVAQDRDQWRALSSTIKKHLVPSNPGEFWSS
jgi:hypothetical protein